MKVNKRIFLPSILLLVLLTNATTAYAQAIPSAVTQACNQKATQAQAPGGGIVSALDTNVYECDVAGEGGGASYYFDQNGNPTAVNGVSSSNITGNFNSSGQLIPGGAVCNGFVNFFSNPFTCMGRAMATFIGSALIWLASWVLTLAGLLFNWVVTNTILQFGTVVNANVINAINITWSAFRDISNIVIIGMFTFIAIMTILGSTDYGAKKLVSRVLIVAVLINFSLLFTKIIIDASNFTAIQFLNAAAASGACTDCSQLNQTASAGGVSVNSTATGNTAGLAGAFMKYAGADTFGNTYDALSRVSQSPQNGGWYALLYGIFISLFELMAALVLFYGAFLLITRALLMIFLMITSSIAFASYLVPALSQNYGWNAWWSALLKNAVFAPLLAVLLWVTLTVAQAYNGAAGGSLGRLVVNPTESSLDIAALFGYILVIGLLFISIRVASSFSAQIGGFNWTQAALSSPFAAANKLTAPALRNLPWIGGRGAAARAQTLGKEIDKEARVQARLPESERNLSKLTDLIRQKDKAEARSKKTFDFANTNLGQTIGKAVKVPGPLLAKTKTSFADTAKKKADEAAKAAAEVAVAPKDAKDTAREEIEKQYKDTTDELMKQQREDNAMLAQAIKESKDKKDGEGLEEKLKTAILEARRQEDVKTKNEVAIQERFAKGEIDQAEKDRQFREQDERIKTARATVATINARIAAIDRPKRDAEAAADRSTKALEAHKKDLEKRINARADEIRGASIENAQEVGAQLTQNWMQRMLNVTPNSVVSKKARSLVKKKIGTKGLKERALAQQEALGDAGEAVSGGGKNEGGESEEGH